jgi:hypothetical protein
MKHFTLRLIFVATWLVAPAAFTMRGASEPPAVEQGHRSGMTAKVTLTDGVTRTVKLEGVGCSVSLCSRTAISGRAEHDSIIKTWFDTVAEIRDTTDLDALFVMKDGTQRRMGLMTDFRVVYLASPAGAAEKVDLSKIKSIEFLAASR